MIKIVQSVNRAKYHGENVLLRIFQKCASVMGIKTENVPQKLPQGNDKKEVSTMAMEHRERKCVSQSQSSLKTNLRIIKLCVWWKVTQNVQDGPQKGTAVHTIEERGCQKRQLIPIFKFQLVSCCRKTTLCLSDKEANESLIHSIDLLNLYNIGLYCHWSICLAFFTLVEKLWNKFKFLTWKFYRRKLCKKMRVSHVVTLEPIIVLK